MTRIIAGHRPVFEALRGKTVVRHILVEQRDRFADIEEAAVRGGVRIETKPRAELDQLSDGARHQGVVAIAESYVFLDVDELTLRAAQSGSIFVALDEITDPQNLGAIIRSAVTLGTHGLIIPKHRAATITPAVVRASAGATEHAAIARVTNLQRSLLALQKAGTEIIGLDANADLDVRDLPPSSSSRVIVVGSEGKGLRRMVRQRCDIVVQIAQVGPMDSLNASVAAAIAIHEVVAKRAGVADER